MGLPWSKEFAESSSWAAIAGTQIFVDFIFTVFLYYIYIYIFCTYKSSQELIKTCDEMGKCDSANSINALLK